MTDVVIADQPAQVVITGETTATVLTVGIAGPPGPSGAAGGGFTYQQVAAATVWAIPHNLHRPPGGVRVVDSSGNQVDGMVTDVDNDNLTITFAAALAGSAYLS